MKKKFLVTLVLSFIFTISSLTNSIALAPNQNAFKVKPLPYAYDALEPYIDKETMILHHNKHYQAYVDNLNKALEKYPELYKYSLVELLQNIDTLPKDIQKTVLNNAGGAYNHGFFFDIMSPDKTEPSEELRVSIERDFGSFENFKEQFKQASSSVFGSGWAWLVKDSSGKLSIVTTPNQNSPVSDNLTPVIGLDVWEHAYYLKYKNVRADYIDNWFNVINWKQALENFNGGMKENKVNG
ncbi:superoxide dismutase [Metaclostridioides mangenotii]|uniref:superoxide dismutase n=1 Tax=Metaclostridioides mangenotii TaxID=1540 RepID=UPI000466A5EA|nr:superoxide dismutase [Clostridioides mangenotii]